MSPIVFAIFVASEAQLPNAVVLAESVRAFAGSAAHAPIEVFVPRGAVSPSAGIRARLAALEVELVDVPVSPAAAEWFYGSKPAIAAEAERRARERGAARLVFLDDDTVVLREPREFVLPPAAALGWRPVLHRNIGSIYAEPPDPFWSRLYDLLAVPDSVHFPMEAAADGSILRPYFNAGLLVVAPERGLFHAWRAAFTSLIEDSTLVALCGEDPRRKIFLHQAALAGAAQAHLRRDEMLRLPDTVNIPLLFHERYPAARRFDSIENCTTVRTEAALELADPGWIDRLQGPPEQKAWLRERLDR